MSPRTGPYSLTEPLSLNSRVFKPAAFARAAWARSQVQNSSMPFNSDVFFFPPGWGLNEALCLVLELLALRP